jgi:uncharacterized protein (DUF983 family)
MPHRTASPDAAAPDAATYLRRGLRLKCPECGISPIFTPARRVRSLYDWFTPLDGCPRCGFAYVRESGYFLLAICVVNYGVIAGLGLFVAFLFEWLYPLTMWQYMLLVFSPLPLLSFLFARHAKAIFMAIDHYIEPQGRGTLHRHNAQS